MWEVALTSSNEDQVVHLWEIRTGTVLYTYKSNKAATNSISLVGNDYFISAQDKASFQIYTWNKVFISSYSLYPFPPPPPSLHPDHSSSVTALTPTT